MMRTRILTICMIAMGIAFMPQTADAQGLLKKIGKGIEKVNKTLEGATDKANVATGQAVKQENGVIVTNPMSRVFDVELVGAYGVSTSENFGNVELVLKVTMKEPESRIGFGGQSSSHTVAFDGDGNSYHMAHTSTWTNFDVVEGIPVIVVLSGDDAFQKVRKTDVLPIVKLYTHIKYDSAYSGVIQFKNVPVQWDVEH